MATFFIAEFGAAAVISGQNPDPSPLADESSLLAEQVVTVSTEQDSSTLNAATRIVRLVSDTACHYKFAASPTATTSLQYLPANVIEYKGVPANSGYKISVIAH